MPKPTRPGELSAEFLTRALQTAGVLDAGRVVSFDLASVGDAGQTGEVVRVLPRYEDRADATERHAPASLIAKFPAAFPEARAQMQALGLYEREVRFYQEFGADPGIPVPRCYHAEIDLGSGDFVLLLEDLSEGRNGDFWQGSVADAETAIGHLAAFHARWWEHPRLRSTTWLRQPDDMAHYRDALGPLLAACLPVAQQKFPRGLSGYLLQTAQRLTERWTPFIEVQSRGTCTLVHADYHPKQMFFPRAGRGRFAVFDWQSVCVHLGALDLQRVLMTQLLPDQLAKHQDRLFALYHGMLAEHGVQTPLEQLMLETRRAALWTLGVVIWAVATTDVEILRRDADAQGVDLEHRLFAQVGASLEHMDVLSLIP